MHDRLQRLLTNTAKIVHGHLDDLIQRARLLRRDKAIQSCGRIGIEETKKQFSAVMENLYHYWSDYTNEHQPMISKQTYEIVKANATTVDSAMIYNRDFDFNYLDSEPSSEAIC